MTVTSEDGHTTWETHHLDGGDIWIIGSMLEASAPGDDRWIKDTQRRLLREFNQGKLTAEIVAYVLTVMEQIVGQQMLTGSAPPDAVAVRDRFRRELAALGGQP